MVSQNDFETECELIFMTTPEAIGVAYKAFDCGCAMLCGVSGKGEPIGSLINVSGQPPDRHGNRPICLQCRRDQTIAEHRIVQQGIIWPGTEVEKPDIEIRQSIGRRVFGDNFLDQEPTA